MNEAEKEKLTPLGIKVNQNTRERFNELKEEGAFDTSGQFLDTLLERYSNPLKVNKNNEEAVKTLTEQLENIKKELATAKENCDAQVKEIDRLKDVNVHQAKMIEELNGSVNSMKDNIKQTEGHILVPVTPLDEKCLQYLAERENKHYNRKDITPAKFFMYAVKEMLIKGNKFSIDCVPDRVVDQFRKELGDGK